MAKWFWGAGVHLRFPWMVDLAAVTGQTEIRLDSCYAPLHFSGAKIG